MTYKSVINLGVCCWLCFCGLAFAWEDIGGFDKVYQRPYNPVASGNQYAPNNFENPALAVAPSNPRAPQNSLDPGNPENSINFLRPNNPHNPANAVAPDNPFAAQNVMKYDVPYRPLR